MGSPLAAARTDSPKLKDLLGAKDAYGKRLPELGGRDGVAVWGQEFLFAVETEKDAAVSIDKEPPIAMKRVAGKVPARAVEAPEEEWLQSPSRASSGRVPAGGAR